MSNTIQSIRRMAELSLRLNAGSALTPAEAAEHAHLAKTIEAAMAPQPVGARTTLQTMRYADAYQYVQGLMAAPPTADRIQLARKNADALQAQGRFEPDDLVAVEVEVEPAGADLLKAMAAKIDALEAKLAAAQGPPAAAPPPPVAAAAPPDPPAAPPAAQPDPPAAAHEATLQALDALAKRYAQALEKASAGVNRTDMDALFPDWTLDAMIAAAPQLVKSMDALEAAMEAAIPDLEIVAKAGGPPAGTTGDAPPALLDDDPADHLIRETLKNNQNVSLLLRESLAKRQGAPEDADSGAIDRRVEKQLRRDRIEARRAERSGR